MTKRLRLLGLIIFVLGSGLAEAQLVFQPIKSSKSTKTTQSSKGRTNSNTVTIPVWEDFSDYTTNQPDTTLWQNSQNVFISSGRGVNPPSLNVASFDGIQADGSPYSQIATETGKTDSLTTCPIDLSAFTLANDVTLYFFYQFAGFGEQPDESDSLRVEFLNADGDWVSVWPAGDPLDRSGEFVQVVLPVPGPEYLHDAFRFRFQAFGRQSGPFDVWNVDYIFFNEARKPNDRDYPDRAISTPLGPIFLNNYFSIPRVHFNDSVMSTSLVLSENDPDNAGEDVSLDINFEVIDYLDSAISAQNTFSLSGYDDFIINGVQTNILPAGEAHRVSIPGIVPSSIFQASADSTIIRTELILESGDATDAETPKINFPNANFQLNDTTRSTYVLKDYYAYDDGSAEIGVGVNDDGSRLAYEFLKYGDTVNYIVAFDIYFPFVNTSPNGKRINLTVWDQTSGRPGNTLYEETITINAATQLNTFTRFNLSTSVEIEDSVFYIGYRQNTSGFLSVGFDKNTDTSDKIYFNLVGAWEQDPNVRGSLMMRPVFGSQPDSVITSIPEIPEMQDIRIYPNPVMDRLNVMGKHQKIEVISMAGKRMYLAEGREEEVMIEMSSFPKGLYLLRVFTGNQVINRKIIKQ